MRTKALLLGAALSAVGVVTSLAQPVYSVNTVGYVNFTVPANSLAILANPLNASNNVIDTVLPLPPDASGATVFRFDVGLQNYKDGIIFLSGVGWLSTDPNPEILNPGEGFFIQNPNPTDLTVTFVGDVQEGLSTNQIPGGNALKLASSIVPQALRLGDAATAGTLLFPAASGDTVFVWDLVAQGYGDGYIYLDGVGWLHPTDPDPAGPLIPVATGFFTQKAGAAADWTRNFRVSSN